MSIGGARHQKIRRYSSTLRKCEIFEHGSRRVRTTQGLPPFDFYRRQDIPPRLTTTGRKGEQRLGITLNGAKTSPNVNSSGMSKPEFRKSFTTALSYNHDTRMTTWFFGRTTDELELADEKDEFLRMPQRLEANAAHPLLLPVLMYSVCSNTLRRQLRQVNWKIDIVQQKIGC